MCNNVDPNSDAFVSELRITSPGKDILPDLVAPDVLAIAGINDTVLGGLLL